MSLHSIIEPAGTLQTGWKLVPKDGKTADIRNPDKAEENPPVPDADSRSDPRSAWEMPEVR